MTTPQGTPPGWYDDGQGQLRWFDGTAWTEHVQQVPAPPAMPPQASVPAAAVAAPQPVIIEKKSGFMRSCLGVIVGIVVLGLLLIVLLVVVIGSSSDDDGSGDNGGVSQGLGSQDASADVGPVTLSAPDAIGAVYATATVTNNSSKRSDYVIDIAVTSADGATQIGTTIILVTNLEPGQRTEGKGLLTETVPAGAVAKVTGVQRNASL